MAVSTSGNINYFYPFVPQASQTTSTITTSGITWNIPLAPTGFASFNTAGFVFQNDQYNSKREGSGN